MEFFRNHGRNMTEDQNIGFYLEVDLGREADGRTDIQRNGGDRRQGHPLSFVYPFSDCPREIHAKLRDYPLCPEMRATRPEEISAYTTKILKDNKIPLGNDKKLITDVWPKTRYKIHYQNLKICLSLGYQLKRIYSIIKFEQSAFLKSYVGKNV